ncbi:unnamed protein product, partial [Ectocarpus sp. 13 AM-2016]
SRNFLVAESNSCCCADDSTPPSSPPPSIPPAPAPAPSSSSSLESAFLAMTMYTNPDPVRSIAAAVFDADWVAAAAAAADCRAANIEGRAVSKESAAFLSNQPTSLSPPAP